ncbi:hypothetical protein RDI58_024176 [Solanum bulbocastanum]|uniref:Uncharacterized protein n=1 Tax=Solanum bulbocastanum TaxID=147425 RepID=A0AAN8Y324_SOLBU
MKKCILRNLPEEMIAMINLVNSNRTTKQENTNKAATQQNGEIRGQLGQNSQKQQGRIDAETGEGERLRRVAPAEKISNIISLKQPNIQESGAMVVVHTDQTEEEDILLLKELAEAEYQVPLQIADPSTLIPDISTTTKLNISAVMVSSAKSAPMETLHALVSHQSQEDKEVESKDTNSIEFIEDKDEVNSDHKVVEVCK